MQIEKIDYKTYLINANETGAMVFRPPSKSLIHKLKSQSKSEAITEAKSWIDTLISLEQKNRREGHIGTVADFMRALAVISPTDKKLAMLSAHKNAPGRRLTATQLANAADWPDFNTANLHYGNLAQDIAIFLSLDLKEGDGRSWTEALGVYNDETHEWAMHPELAEALERMNIC